MKTAAKKKPGPDESDLVEVFAWDEIDGQGSPEWFRLRRGLPTASCFGTIMASGTDGEASKGRQKLLYQLAGEILSGVPAQTYENEAMRRGKRMEPAAIEHYVFTRGVDVLSVGFVRRTIRKPLGTDLVIGCSPDGLVGTDGLLQIKTMEPGLIVELVSRGRYPTEHRAQVHGEMWVTGRKFSDLKIFYEGMPISPTFRVERDESYIAEIEAAVETFAFDLRRLVADVKKKGGVR